MADDDEHSGAAYTPFRPANGPVDQRIAAALEYIATQLGEINAKLGHQDDGDYEGDDDDRDDDKDDEEKEDKSPRRR